MGIVYYYLEYLKQMRTYAFAAILAIAVGQEEYTWEEAGATDLPEAVEGDISGLGQMGEGKISFDADNFALVFWMGWETIWWNGKYAGGSIMQNYAQWEEGAGVYGGFTCNLLNYSKDNSWNANHVVNNYSGIASMQNADGGNQGPWDGFGEAVSEDGWFMADEDTPQDTYKSVYSKNGANSQKCGAWAYTNL